MAISRKEWRKRLVDANLPEEVVDELLESLKDEDLLRMKDVSTEDFLDMVGHAITKAEGDDDEEEDEDVLAKARKARARARALARTKAKAGGTEEDEEEEEEEPMVSAKDSDASGLNAFADLVADRVLAKIKDTLQIQEVEIEVPELKEIISGNKGLEEKVDALSVVFKEMSEVWSAMFKDTDDILAQQFKEMSPASRQRLRSSLDNIEVLKRAAKFKATIQQGSDATTSDIVVPSDDAIIKDAAGNVYESLSDMAAGTPVD